MANFVLLVSAIVCASIVLCDASCGKLFENKITNAEKEIIVNKHNQLRSLIARGKVPGQPKGKNLKNLKWDAALAREAQKIANTCKNKHVKVKDNRFYVGQNLAWAGTTDCTEGSDWSRMIQMWFDEHKSFKYPNSSNGITGHYTQVVWGDTEYVGCGYTKYRKGELYEHLYVCNYGPGGNYAGRVPYEV
ncbi:venom allergen 5-like [Tenebrio molitor]|uniref:venom allergen 5-like n=1 Tax=Tenebrio molitor TaxID=7067 RepID=UPI0036247B23